MNQLWHGGTIYTMEQENETVEAVLVQNGKITETGTFHDLKRKADEKINLKGAAMYPGFVDSHLHMISLGEKLMRLDLSHATSTNEMLELIKVAAEQVPAHAWLFGDGWNENNFPDKRIPTAEELDAIRKEPIFLTRICHHAALANSSALAFGNISNNTESPSGGKIGKDKHGIPNGRLYDQAMNLITDKLPKEGKAYINSITEALELAIDHMHALGLTGGHTEDLHYYGDFHNPLTAFYHTIGQKHHLRVHLLRHHEVFHEIMEQNVQYDVPFIEAGAMKIFTDGAFGGRTAALSIPYTDDIQNKGILLHTDQELEGFVKLARRHNEAVAIHVIGDQGVEQALDVIEANPVPKGKRDRFIHCSLLRPDLLERIAKLPIVVDAQPAFVPSDFPWIEERLGNERLACSYPWRTIIDLGIMCAAGTDGPIENIDPLETIYAAVERKSLGEAHDGNIPEQKISRFEAVQMYTIGSAQAISKEHERGLIKQGYDADFSIFDRDLFAGTSEDMLEAKAVKTVVAGNIVYELKV